MSLTSNQRQQKKKILEESLQSQNEESCTFTPHIYTQKKHFQVDSRPVHIRLSEKGREYAEQLEQRKQHFHTYDDSGQRLFRPKIIPQIKPTPLPSSMMSTTTASTPAVAYQTAQYPLPASEPVNNMSADDFLYQDAKDREQRLKELIAQQEQERQEAASRSKVNKASQKMLIQKAVSDLLGFFFPFSLSLFLLLF